MSRPEPHARAGAQGGFTLVELVVVLALAALLMGALGASYSRLNDSVGYRATLRELTAGLHAARNLAQRQGREVHFDIDLRRRCFGLGGRCDSTIPDPLKVELHLAAQDLDPRGHGRLRFYPDGGATGGSIVLARPNGQGVRLRIDWLLGRISQEAWSG
ncbi:GspH/FimT family protein [Thauera sp. SDU_THAU2]|uniref:GspH/FimT family protein n=1 Tax=Thauera sp. SDU_THAU2 TaxID=3136633 RepID=UPI00311E3A47